MRARCVVNAAGVWVDRLRNFDGQISGIATKNMVLPSQGVHIVVGRQFLDVLDRCMEERLIDRRTCGATLDLPWVGELDRVVPAFNLGNAPGVEGYGTERAIGSIDCPAPACRLHKA